MVDPQEDSFASRLPTILGGVLATLAIVIAGLWISGKTGLPSPEAVLSLAKPAASVDPDEPVYTVGDSVLLGAKPCLKGTVVKAHAEQNRTMAQGAALVEQKAADGTLPQRVVIALGTNAPFGFAALDRIMRAAGPDRHVYFVTVELPESDYYGYEDPVNQRLRAMPGRWPNAHVIDWNASVLVDGLYPDGIHLNPQGCQAYANLLLQGVQKF